MFENPIPREIPPRPTRRRFPRRRTPINIPQDLLPQETPRAENEKPGEATHVQLSAANVQFALKLDELCKNKAKEVVELELGKPYRKRDYFKVRRIANPLMELYILRYNHLSLDEFKKKWKGEASKFTKYLNAISDDIENEKNSIMSHAAEITDEERRQITKSALRKISGRHHREAIVSMDGWSEEQRNDHRRKYKKSTAWSLVTTVASIPVIGTTVTTVAAMTGGHISYWEALLAAGGLWLARNGSIRLATNAHEKALNDPEVSASFSVGATAAHDVTTNVLPEDEDLKRKAMYYATGFPSFVQDAIYSPGIIFNPLLYAGRLAGETLFYTGEAVTTETYLLYRKAKKEIRRRRMEQREREDN